MRALGVAVVVPLAVAAASPARAAVVADAGSLRAQVPARHWHLTLSGRDGALVLTEHPGVGRGPTGTLGFRTADGAWHHATRVLEARRRGRSYSASLATAGSSRRIAVRLEPDASGVVGLDARLIGSPAKVEAIGIAFRARPDERYFGFGERSNAVDQRGRDVEDYVGEGPYQANEYPLVSSFVPSWGVRQRRDATYFPMPWLLSSSGYGVLVGNTSTGYFDLATADRSAWRLEVTRVPTGYTGPATGPPPDELRVRFFAGPTPADALRRLTDRIGRQPAPEPWFLGPWFQPGDDRRDSRLLRRSDSPVSVAQTYTHYLPCGAQAGQTDAERGRTRLLHSLGYAVTTYFNPMICTDYSPPYGDAARAGALTLGPSGAPYVYRYVQFVVSQFDFTVPAAKSAYSRLLGQAIANGYDGWMEDFGEYTPLDSRSLSGPDGTEMHNRYPLLYHCAANHSTKFERRPLLRFVRSGWTGSARCSPVVWGGDPTTSWGFDGLRSAVKEGLSMGLSGVGIWGSDIGGFFALFDNRLTPELLKRWVQLGAVSGAMRTEADGLAIPAKPRPQVFDPDQLANWRRYSKLRTELYPYIRAAAATYRRDGLPIMRDLALAYPEDDRAIARQGEFLFGPDLLAAPVLREGARSRSLYLPRGRWIDLWRSVRYLHGTGGLEVRRASVVRGGRRVTVPAPLEQLPLLARAGTLLPLLPPDVDTLAPFGRARGLVHLSDRRGRIDLIAFPRGSSSARFLGSGRLRSAVERGRWTLAIDDSRARTWRIQASLGAASRPFRPCMVAVDGRRLPRRAWEYRPHGRVLTVRFRARAANARLVASRRRCIRRHGGG